jgi:hypothetical protein
MATLRDYCRSEARAYIDGLSRLLRDDDSMEARPEMLRLVRGLRGAAQLARDDSLMAMAGVLEGAAHALLEGGLAWSTDVRERVERTVGDVDVILAEAESEDAVRQRVESANARWQAVGVAPWAPGSGGGAGATRAVQPETGDFLSFAASEVTAIVEVMQESLDVLTEDPMDRDAMKSVLRRQRALLGAAPLEELPVVAEVLRAVEDVSRVISRMNVPIKDEWLDVFRCARVVLEAAADPLTRGEDPPHTPALSRLRTYRQELLERYGGAEDLPANVVEADTPAALPDPGPVIEPQTGAAGRREDRPVDIQNLVYTGDAALRRALELRARLERAVEHDPDALALVDEVFDLIRLGLR